MISLKALTGFSIMDMTVEIKMLKDLQKHLENAKDAWNPSSKDEKVEMAAALACAKASVEWAELRQWKQADYYVKRAIKIEADARGKSTAWSAFSSHLYDYIKKESETEERWLKARKDFLSKS